MQTRDDVSTRLVTCAGCLAIALWAGAVRASDKQDDGNAKSSESGKLAAKPLCDSDWAGGFWTVAVDEKKYDGNAKALKDYDPNHPDEPWQVLSEKYLRHKDCCGNVNLHKFIGRFNEKTKAEAFLRRVYSDSGFARHLNPRYPQHLSSPGALLVSDKYTCTLNKENDTLSKANWIVEVDGHLFAGTESSCKQGSKKKTITVVDCAGSKIVVKDTLEVPCEARVRSCLYPLPDEAFAVDHDYSLAAEGTTVAVRAYDMKKKQQVFSVDGTNDGDADTVIITVEDIDKDGVPEIVHRVAGTGEIVEKMKWRNRRFVKVGR
jgi:hypothetical protein